MFSFPSIVLIISIITEVKYKETFRIQEPNSAYLLLEIFFSSKLGHSATHYLCFGFSEY
jgi:hypothetical protein